MSPAVVLRGYCAIATAVVRPLEAEVHGADGTDESGEKPTNTHAKTVEIVDPSTTISTSEVYFGDWVKGSKF